MIKKGDHKKKGKKISAQRNAKVVVAVSAIQSLACNKKLDDACEPLTSGATKHSITTNAFARVQKTAKN